MGKNVRSDAYLLAVLPPNVLIVLPAHPSVMTELAPPPLNYNSKQSIMLGSQVILLS
jgi:hypothetical protein